MLWLLLTLLFTDYSAVGNELSSHPVTTIQNPEATQASHDDAASFPKVVKAGYVTFLNRSATLPLYGVETVYGVDWSESVSITPQKELPPIPYNLPETAREQLAAFWINEGGGDGIVLLAPKEWLPTSSGVGANGSIGVTFMNPTDAKETLTYQTSGACQGCAISNIATYFPELAQWAEDYGFPGDQKQFLAQKLLNEAVMQYAVAPPATGYETVGLAYQTHEPGDAFFSAVEITASKSRQGLSDAVLDFYAAQYKQPDN